MLPGWFGGSRYQLSLPSGCRTNRQMLVYLVRCCPTRSVSIENEFCHRAVKSSMMIRTIDLSFVPARCLSQPPLTTRGGSEIYLIA